MGNQIQKCPVCGKPLTQEEYDKALGIWKAKHDEIKHLKEKEADLKRRAAVWKKEMEEVKRNSKRAVAEEKRKFTASLREQRKLDKETFKKKLEERVAKGISKDKHKREQLEQSLKIALEKKEKGDQEIKRLKEQMEKGITPQIEGLLEEDKLLAKLKGLFPHDHFDHPGKGGDIIQTIIEQEKPIGKIVYECKRVKSFSQSHVQQAASAREQRQANFAVLVTNAFPAKMQSYFVSNTVFVIGPINVEPVTYILRQSLVKIALLRLSNAEKMKAVNEVYKYLSGNEYSDRVNGMAYQLITLAGDLKSEIHAHHQNWKKRYATYKNLYTDVGVIDSRLKALLALGVGKTAELQKLASGSQNYPLLEELEGK